ncbi:MAG: M48 family metalloprotease [Myxococcota bacterium]
MSNVLKTLFLLSLLASVLVALGWALGGAWPWILGAMALLMNVGAYFWSDKIVLRMHGAREVSPEEAPRLHAMVEEIARRADIPKPRVFRIADPTPNAFATGRDPAHGVVAVTDGIVQLLDERELRGVIAHEIAHIKNRDILIATIGAVLAGAVSHIASAVQWAAILGTGSDEEEDGGGGVGALVLAFVAPFAAMLLQFAVSRAREFGADATGAALAEDPEALARALEKLQRGAMLVPPAAATPATASLFIVNPLSATERAARWFSTHPATEERVARLRSMGAARG